MKKGILVFLFISFFFLCSNVKAECYEVCEQLISGKNNCVYSTECNEDGQIACKTIDDSYCGSPKVSCGNITGIPKKIPELTNFFVIIVQVIVPVILVIMGSIDLIKGLTSQKEDEIKKGQQIFIKRLIIGGIIFFVIVIAKFLVSLIAEGSSNNIANCIDCFFSNVDSCK